MCAQQRLDKYNSQNFADQFDPNICRHRYIKLYDLRNIIPFQKSHSYKLGLRR